MINLYGVFVNLLLKMYALIVLYHIYCNTHQTSIHLSIEASNWAELDVRVTHIQTHLYVSVWCTYVRDKCVSFVCHVCRACHLVLAVDTTLAPNSSDATQTVFSSVLQRALVKWGLSTYRKCITCLATQGIAADCTGAMMQGMFT